MRFISNELRILKHGDELWYKLALSISSSAFFFVDNQPTLWGNVKGRFKLMAGGHSMTILPSKYSQSIIKGGKNYDIPFFASYIWFLAIFFFFQLKLILSKSSSNAG